MSQDLLDGNRFSDVIAGLPRVAELITTVPEERRPDALAAAEASYRRSAHALGYDETGAQEWASAVMSRLQVEISQRNEAGSRQWASALMSRLQVAISQPDAEPVVAADV